MSNTEPEQTPEEVEQAEMLAFSRSLFAPINDTTTTEGETE